MFRHTRLMHFDLARAEIINPYDRYWAIAIFIVNINCVGPGADAKLYIRLLCQLIITEVFV